MRSLVRSMVLTLAMARCRGRLLLSPVAADSPTPTPVTLGVKVVTPPEQMRLEVSNGTTIPVMLTVNGAAGRPIPAGQRADLGLSDLGPLPWVAQIRTGAGRVARGNDRRRR